MTKKKGIEIKKLVVQICFLIIDWCKRKRCALVAKWLLNHLVVFYIWSITVLSLYLKQPYFSQQKARRRSMSSSDFDDKRSTMSSRMFYHSSVRAPPLLVDDFLGSPRTGPDVTLATNAVSTLTLQQYSFHPSSAVNNSGQESPDLVNTGELVEGATATGIYNSSSWKTSPQQRMSQSYSTGPSHMYLWVLLTLLN